MGTAHKPTNSTYSGFVDVHMSTTFSSPNHEIFHFLNKLCCAPSPLKSCVSSHDVWTQSFTLSCPLYYYYVNNLSIWQWQIPTWVHMLSIQHDMLFSTTRDHFFIMPKKFSILHKFKSKQLSICWVLSMINNRGRWRPVGHYFRV